MIKVIRLCLLSFLLGGLIESAAAANLPIVRLVLGSGTLDAEVAVNKSQRALGLMNRSSIPESHGMLFAYPVPTYFCMWMKNTKVPLSVAFIDSQGQVINIEDMAPQTENTHCPQRNATYALEANRGWFARHGVVPGTQVIGLEKVLSGEN